MSDKTIDYYSRNSEEYAGDTFSADMSDVIAYMAKDNAPDSLQQMAANTSAMVRHAIDAFVRHNEDIARNVISQDDAMANVKKKLEGHFVLPKVVK